MFGCKTIFEDGTKSNTLLLNDQINSRLVHYTSKTAIVTTIFATLGNINIQIFNIDNHGILCITTVETVTLHEAHLTLIQILPVDGVEEDVFLHFCCVPLTSSQPKNGGLEVVR